MRWRKPEVRTPRFRRTIKEPGRVNGVGIHSGEEMTIVFHPAESGSGIRFFRGDKARPWLPVNLESVIDTSLAVTVGNGDWHVQTVEHLMFAVFSLGITDLTMELTGHSEVPILDGSALTFVEALQACEFHEYPDAVDPLIISEAVSVSDGNRYIIGLPASGFTVSYHIDYPHPLLTNQALQVDFSQREEVERIQSARTFGFLRDLEYLKSRGLGQGGSVENVLIYTNDGTMNYPRYHKESVYHKILDLVGDLSLIGRPLEGHILASRAGHALDIAFGKKISHVEQKFCQIANQKQLQAIESISENR